MNMLINKSVTEHHEQNVHFHDQNADWNYTVPSQPDPTFGIVDSSEATLANFFARPIRIHTQSWNVSTGPYFEIDPWTLFFENPRVSNRIANYNLLRSKLCVKVIINGNGFYYGRMIVAYYPRQTSIEGIIDPGSSPVDLVQLSQLPHIYLDPTNSQGGSMCLPFFHHKNALSIPSGQWDQMGLLKFSTMNVLYHALDPTAADITISVFAWAEDVELSIPTAINPSGLTAQMGSDEYGVGPVSRPANILARAAGALANIPAIGTYAKATQGAAAAVAGIATAFGYSRPVVLTNSQTVKPEFVGVLANTNAHDNATKLTLDCKQELTVDPRVVGLGDSDEMTILSLAKRESYLTAFAWPLGAVADPEIFQLQITPCLYNRSDVLQTSFHPTPMMFAALPFSYWRGSIKVRFQIVASSFHKGRLRIAYDPISPVGPSPTEYNINYAHIIDLANERDFTLTVGWGQSQTWLPITEFASATGVVPFSTPAIDPLSLNISANGQLSVFIVNDLTGPSTTESDFVSVNVFVSAGDDFEVCVPSCANIANYSYLPAAEEPALVAPFDELMTPQSGQMGDEDFTTQESAPTMPNTLGSLAEVVDTADHTLDVFFGDPVVSFRQCLKRYNHHVSWPVPISGTKWQWFLLRNSDFPLYRGYHSTAIWTTKGGFKYNYVKNTLLNYLTPAFAGRRGGIRWKYVMHGCSGGGPGTMLVTKGGPAQGIIAPGSIADLANTDTDAARAKRAHFQADFMPHTWCATHATNLTQNNTVEVEIPFYSPLRFYEGRRIDLESSGSEDSSYHVVRSHLLMDGNWTTWLDAYVSTAEDFSLYFFSGVPRMFYVQTPLPLV